MTFTHGANVLAANVALNGSGQATFSTTGLSEGNHIIQATYNADPSFATSSGTVNQRVDNNTTVTGNTYCNTGPITINDNGPATPYPSNIFVTGAGTTTSKVTVTLNNVSHTFAGDVEALLVGPGGQNLVVLSDAGTAGVSNVTVTFDDAAAGTLPAAGTWATPGSSISARPTNHAELTPDTFPPPAPASSAATALATFNGANPNGTWSLYVGDDGAPDTGSIAGGWCITVSTLASPTLTTQASAGGPVGTQVNDVATLAGGANPTGSITFNLYGPGNNTCTGSPVHTSNVVVSGNGTYTSSNFTPTSVGTYRWVATYGGDANNAPAGPTACLDPAEDVTITLAQPTIATQAASSSSVTATSSASITDTATLAGGVNPTGILTFALFGPDNATCAGPAVFTSTEPVAGNGVYVSEPFATAALGAYRWVVTYCGDANNLGATSPCNAPNETSDVTVVCSAVPPAGTLPGNTIVVAQPGVITTGTPGDDVIYGTEGDDRIDGAGGNDVIFGGGGRDQLTGGEGIDTVCGGEGNDQLVGSLGNDLLSGDAGNDDLAGVAGVDRLVGGPGVNRLSGGDGVDACSPGPDPASQAASCETAVV